MSSNLVFMAADKQIDDGLYERKVAERLDRKESQFWPGIADVRRSCLEGAGLITPGAPLPAAGLIYGDNIAQPQMGLATLLSPEELAAITAPSEGEEPPIALTDQHVAAIERAILRAGYTLAMDTSTGEFELVPKSVEYRHVEVGYEFKPDGAGNVIGNFHTVEKSA